jgi:hypothetical protein
MDLGFHLETTTKPSESAINVGNPRRRLQGGAQHPRAPSPPAQQVRLYFRPNLRSSSRLRGLRPHYPGSFTQPPPQLLIIVSAKPWPPHDCSSQQHHPQQSKANSPPPLASASTSAPTRPLQATAHRRPVLKNPDLAQEGPDRAARPTSPTPAPPGGLAARPPHRDRRPMHHQGTPPWPGILRAAVPKTGSCIVASMSHRRTPRSPPCFVLGREQALLLAHRRASATPSKNPRRRPAPHHHLAAPVTPASAQRRPVGGAPPPPPTAFNGPVRPSPPSPAMAAAGGSDQRRLLVLGLGPPGPLARAAREGGEGSPRSFVRCCSSPNRKRASRESRSAYMSVRYFSWR